MTPLEAAQLVYAAIRTGMVAVDADLAFEGERFSPEADRAWVRVHIRALPTLSVTHGPPGQRRARRRRMVIAQCFAPIFPDDGVARAGALAAQVQALLDGRDLEGAAGTCNFEPADSLPIAADKTWFQTNVTAPFQFNETF